MRVQQLGLAQKSLGQGNDIDAPNLILGNHATPLVLEKTRAPLLSHCFVFYSHDFLISLGCFAGPTVLQPSAFPVGSQPAQTFQGVSCSDRYSLLRQLEKLEQLLFRTEPSSPGRDDTHYLGAVLCKGTVPSQQLAAWTGPWGSDLQAYSPFGAYSHPT